MDSSPPFATFYICHHLMHVCHMHESLFLICFLFVLKILFINERHTEREAETQAEGEVGSTPVSYTHLTLPTSDLV